MLGSRKSAIANFSARPRSGDSADLGYAVSGDVAIGNIVGSTAKLSEHLNGLINAQYEC